MGKSKMSKFRVAKAKWTITSVAKNKFSLIISVNVGKTILDIAISQNEEKRSKPLAETTVLK
jgi:hypothetical protein